MKYFVINKTRVSRENVIVSKDIHPSGKVAYDSKGYMVDKETRKPVEIDEPMAKQLEQIGFAIEPTEQKPIESKDQNESKDKKDTKPITKMNLEELKSYSLELGLPVIEDGTKAEYILTITSHLTAQE